MLTLQEIELALLDGDLDKELDLLADAVRSRQDYLAKRAVVGIRPGDTVRFSDSIRPRYLIGQVAKVQKVNPKSIVVDCPVDPSYGRFSGSQNVRCPVSLIAGKV
jgi:hypothetical protein